MKIFRVPYGKKNVAKEDREYQIIRGGPVGTIQEFKDKFPDEKFEIIDNINPEDEVQDGLDN